MRSETRGARGSRGTSADQEKVRLDESSVGVARDHRPPATTSSPSRGLADLIKAESKLPSHNIPVGQVLMGEIKNAKRSSSSAVSHKESNVSSNICANEEQVGEDDAMPKFVV